MNDATDSAPLVPCAVSRSARGDRAPEQTMDTTYTVRPLGYTSWQDGLPDLLSAARSRDVARDRGLSNVVVVDDTTGEVVPDDVLDEAISDAYDDGEGE